MNPANQGQRDNAPAVTKKNAAKPTGDKVLSIFGKHAQRKKEFLKSLKIV